MIGLIPHLLLGFVRRERGHGSVEASLRAAGLAGDTQFYLDRPYDDGTWQRLFAAAALECGLEASAFDYQFGRYVADDFAGRFPGFFVGASTLRGMLMRQIQVHYQLARSMRDPETRRMVASKFEVVDDGEVLVIRYRSPNDHLGLYRGAADRLAELVGERVELVVDDRRTGAGADYLLRLKFHGRAPAGASA